MLLQIYKYLIKDGKENVRTDLIDGVKRVNMLDGFVMVEFHNGDVFSFSKNEKDNSFTIDSSEEFKNYLIDSVYLLNNEGKTLNRLI